MYYVLCIAQTQVSARVHGGAIAINVIISKTKIYSEMSICCWRAEPWKIHFRYQRDADFEKLHDSLFGYSNTSKKTQKASEIGAVTDTHREKLKIKVMRWAFGSICWAQGPSWIQFGSTLAALGSNRQPRDPRMEDRTCKNVLSVNEAIYHIYIHNIHLCMAQNAAPLMFKNLHVFRMFWAPTLFVQGFWPNPGTFPY